MPWLSNAHGEDGRCVKRALGTKAQRKHPAIHRTRPRRPRLAGSRSGQSRGKLLDPPLNEPDGAIGLLRDMGIVGD